MIIYAILLKNKTKDENGLPNYIWATKSQVDIITEMRNSPDKRYNFVKINSHIFSPMDISYIEEKNTQECGLPIPKYVYEKYLEENHIQEKPKMINSDKKLTRKELIEQDYA